MKTRLAELSERQKLLEISTLIASTLDSGQVARLLADGLTALIPYDTMAIYRANYEKQELRPIIVHGPYWEDPDHGEWSIPFDHGIIGSAIRNGKGECVANAHLDSRSVYPTGAAIQIEQIIAIPLRIGEKSWGALVMNRMSDHSFSKEEFESAQFLASYASLSLNNIHLIEEVTERQEKFRTLLLAIPDNPVKVDRQGKILEQTSENQLIGSVHNMFPEPVARLFIQHIGKALDSAAPSEFEFTQLSSGKTGIFEARVIPLSVDECLLLARDITSIRRDQEELKDIQSLKQVIMEAVSEAVITIDENERIIFCNDVTEKIFGYSPPELVGQSLQIILPNYLKRIPLLALTASAKKGPGKPVSLTSLKFAGLHKLGNEIPLEISLGEAFTNDRRIFTAIIRDVTERNKSEESLKSTTSRLKNLILTLQAGVLVEDERRHIVLTNQMFCDMFEIPASAEALTGMDCSDAAEKSKHLFREPEVFASRILTLIKKQQVCVNEEMTMVSGKVYARDYVPIFVDRTYKGHMWLYRDITDIKDVEKSLLKAKQLAEESGNAKQDFLAKMSHELRTPINGVLGLTNLLYNTPQSKESLDYLNGIRFSGEQLLSIVNDILDLSKIEAGKFKFDVIDFNPREVITRLIKNLQPQAAERNIRLEAFVDEDIPEFVKGDPVRLNQILLNLISNGLKFTLKGEVLVYCSMTRPEGDFCLLKFSVKDTGIGIAQEKLEMIFERFTQADNKTSVRFGGTGLGLTIVKQLTEMQGGKVEVFSEINKGTTFEASIPYEQGKAQDRPQQSETWADHQNFDGSSVLLVEDNVVNQLVARKTLEKWHIKVTVAENGLLALKHLRSEQKFDLILMDVQMPEMDGFEATHNIRQNFEEPIRSIPIIAMTASVLFDPEGRVKLAGMNDYISKPFGLSELNALLAKYLIGAAASGKSNKKAGTPLLNMNFLEEISPDNPGFQVEMVELFKRQSDTYLKDITAAYAAKDFHLLRQKAHAFKPLGAYIGMDPLTLLVGKLEKSASEAVPSEGQIQLLIRQIDAMVKEATPEIDIFIAQNNSTHGKQ